MNELTRLQPPEGSRKKRKRIGRGIGSGHGKTSTKGQKGQKTRRSIRPGFEGGQMPLQRRLPKRGFKPLSRTRYAVLNVVDLNHFDAGTEVTPELLAAEGFIRSPKDLVKILGDGDLEKPLHVKAHKFSGAAAEKIAAKGGTTEVL